METKPATETWRNIPSTPGYQISNLGRLRTLAGKVRKPCKDHTGSLTVALRIKDYNTTVRIARLVGEVFCKAYRPDRRPIYRNGDRSDCRPCNLRWVSASKVTGAPYSRKPRPSA
jgi:hypothetical protein